MIIKFKFWSSGPVHTSIRRSFKYQFKKLFLVNNNHLLSIYSEEIIVLSVFLLISSSFMFKKNEDNNDFDFDWKSYLSIFKSTHMKDFILCSIRYLLDSEKITINRDLIIKAYRNELKENFSKQYMNAFVYGKSNEINTRINFEKYIEALDLVLKINNIYCREIPKNSSKVLDLVEHTTIWKKKMFELFNKKSEYIVFSFFVNLSSK